MIIVTHVHMVGGEGHQHIAEVKWWNPASGEMKASTTATVVDFINSKKGTVRVTDGTTIVNVRVVAGSPPYLRTVADGKQTDNLLALPRY